MILSFHPCFDADHQVILGDRRVGPEDRALIRRAKAVILPQGRPDALYEACVASDAVVFPDYRLRFDYPGKIGQSRLFESMGCPCPKTYRWASLERFTAHHPGPDRYPHGLPFVVKTDLGHEGDGVFIVDDRQDLLSAFERIRLKEGSGSMGFVTQKYIPCGGNVLRSVIIGKRVITYWKRPAHPADRITTISRGAGIDHDWRSDLQEKGRRTAVDFTERTKINLAAIDFVFSLAEDDPEPLFLEINYYFGRRGLGGSEKYYSMVYGAIREWLGEAGLDVDAVKLV